MYWCNSIINKKSNSDPSAGKVLSLAFLLVLFYTILLPSCKSDIEKSSPIFFDIKGYFHADSLRLTKLNHLTTKTVTHNGVTETKKVHINNWGLELNLFSQSDINKPAWRDSYTIQDSGNTITYRAKTFDLKTQVIIINKNSDHTIKWILIYNIAKNMLYQTTEKLSYFPDSLYVIQKYQKVRLLGANKYTIKGTLN
jgi:hypothetical protein